VTELELLHYIEKNPRKGQKLLYDQYAKGFFRVCLRYCSQYPEAEEAVLSGFLKIFQNISCFLYVKEGNLNAWMKRIMVNEALMIVRKKKGLELDADLEQLEIVSSTSPDQELEAEDIYQVIQELPTGYRTVFNLYAIEGYTHKEIAEALNISINTSKSQLSKARNYLQKIILKREVNYEF
jgi:RNA polymerase sigma-70 factor (ECF subfamily)